MPTLNWIGKDRVVNYAVPFHVLERVYNFGGATDNKIIHGDNLLALKSLLPEYEGRVKCVYIDPPYNTGNEGWIYNDRVNAPQIKRWIGEVVGREGEDLSRHDKWLCMMYPRLKLLKRLLADDGAIFISIDDNEQANLKLICDEIFGAQNFVGTVCWQKIHSLKNDARWLSDSHDFILIYAKDKLTWRPNLLPRTAEMDARYKNPDNDPRGPWQSGDLVANEERVNGYYDVISPTGKIFNVPRGKHWVYTKENLNAMIADNRVWFGKDGNSFPRKKRFLSEVMSGRKGDTWWTSSEVGHNQEAIREVKNILSGGDVFSTPKPTRLIEKILRLATDKNSIVLDSFAGSGTTAHAVLKLNATDGGNRTFILVEMEDYAERITAERVRRVIDGYGTVAGTGGGFDFYEVGEPLMIDGNLNEAVDAEKIRAYVWYTETRTRYIAPADNNRAYLGEHDGTAIYFHYERGKLTTLDAEFLRTIERRAERYLIYADECALSDEFLRGHAITFKKIPRDIKRSDAL